MKQPKNINYLIAAVVLPDEDLRALCGTNLVFARTAAGFTGGAFLNPIDWEQGTGAIGSKFAGTWISPDDFACDVIDEIPIHLIEHLGQSSIYVKPEAFKNIHYHVAKIEILGASGSAKLLDKLRAQGIEQIHCNGTSCVGIRGAAV